MHGRDRHRAGTQPQPLDLLRLQRLQPGARAAHRRQDVDGVLVQQPAGLSRPLAALALGQ